MNVYDVIIIGGGPAGLTAGLYAARGGMDALLIESLSVIGQATMTEFIENYPGIDRMGGFDLLAIFKKQAKSFGLKCQEGTISNILRISEGNKDLWQIKDDSNVYRAHAVIIASGASPKKLGIPGEKEFLGKGVSYCATCDGIFFRDKTIVVIGGGDTAVEESLFLTKFGKKVYVIHRRDRLRAVKVIQERAFSNKKMEFVWESQVEEIAGQEKVEKVIVRNIKTNERKEILCDGVFVFVGWLPNTSFLKGLIELDSHGAIIVDSEMKASKPGIFAAGDACMRPLHQIVTACGDGAIAAYSAQKYVEQLKGVAYG